MAQGITPQQALQQAIDVLGSQAAMSRICSVSQPSVFKWLKRGKPLPAEYVLKVEAATGVPKEDLRPDIYPRDVETVPSSNIANDGAGGSASPPARADSTVPDSLSGLSA